MTGRALPQRISFVLCDVDGTLVTRDKVLKPATIEAVGKLRRAGIGFALASARPPRGLSMLVEPLQIEQPCAAFNGGAILGPDLQVIEYHPIPQEVVKETYDLLLREPVDLWSFTRDEWLVFAQTSHYLPLERRTIGFEPRLVDPDHVPQDLGKIVAVSQDFDHLARLEDTSRHKMGAHATVARSRPYYLDITSPQAEKGLALERICRRVGVDPAETIAIGDGVNDVEMLKRAAFGIAIGNGSQEARDIADHITASNEDDGVAKAIDFLLEPR